jgi:hypothetical protein
VEENAKLGQKLKEVQDVSVSSRSVNDNQLKVKEAELITLKDAI